MQAVRGENEISLFLRMLTQVLLRIASHRNCKNLHICVTSINPPIFPHRPPMTLQFSLCLNLFCSQRILYTEVYCIFFPQKIKNLKLKRNESKRDEDRKDSSQRKREDNPRVIKRSSKDDVVESKSFNLQMVLCIQGWGRVILRRGKWLNKAHTTCLQKIWYKNSGLPDSFYITFFTVLPRTS